MPDRMVLARGNRLRSDQLRQMPFRLAFEQPERATAIGANEIEQVGRSFGDARQNGSGARKPSQEVVDLSRPRRLQIGQPISQMLSGFVRYGQMRAVHEPRGQTMSVRVALRG